MESGFDSKAFLGRYIAALVTGQKPEGFARQEVQRMMCSWCADGWPFDENGQHNVLGVKVDCEVGHQCIDSDETALSER